MSGYLLDTNCISEIVRIRPEPSVIRWLDDADEQSFYLSALTLGEIRKGIANMPARPRIARLETWLTKDLRQRFAGRILPIDEAVAERWGALMIESKRIQRTIPVIDALLAATALHHGLTVVSRNVADFAQSRRPLSSIPGRSSKAWHTG